MKRNDIDEFRIGEDDTLPDEDVCLAAEVKDVIDDVEIRVKDIETMVDDMTIENLSDQIKDIKKALKDLSGDLY